MPLFSLLWTSSNYWVTQITYIETLSPIFTLSIFQEPCYSSECIILNLLNIILEYTIWAPLPFNFVSLKKYSFFVALHFLCSSNLTTWFSRLGFPQVCFCINLTTWACYSSGGSSCFHSRVCACHIGLGGLCSNICWLAEVSFSSM